MELWRTYIRLTEAEAALGIHKSDLAIRPIWDQKSERIQAYILVCFLGYVVATLDLKFLLYTTHPFEVWKLD